MRSPINVLKKPGAKMVEPWNKQGQPSSDQQPIGGPEEDMLAPQNGKDFSNFTSGGSPNIVNCYDVSANVKEHPDATNGMQVYRLQIGQDKEVTRSHEDVKVNDMRTDSVTCTYQEEVVMQLNGDKSEDFTIVKKVGNIQGQICRMDTITERISEPIILICQKADAFGGSLSSGSDDDSLSAASDSPIFSIDQDLSLWSTLWDPPTEPGPLKQLNADRESLQQLSNERENSLKLISRLETWSTGVKKKFRSQFHQLTQKVKPKTRSPAQMKVEEDDRLREGHIQEDGFSDIPLV